MGLLGAFFINKMDRYRRYIIFCFFAALFCLGFALYRDYGISCDEPHSRQTAGRIYQSLLTGDKAIRPLADTPHGNFYGLFLIFLEKSLRIDDTRQIFLMRHGINYLIFLLGCVAFYFLCRSHFKSWKIAMVGALFLVASPIIFSNAFYNPMDLPFMSFFIINIYLLLRFLRKKSFLGAVVLAAASSFLMQVRVAAIFIPCSLLLFLLLELVEAQTEPAAARRIAFLLVFYLALFLFFTAFLNPTVPRAARFLRYYMIACKVAQHIPYYKTYLYCGKVIQATSPPWHYLPVWMVITTPLTYVCFFLLGLVISVRHAVSVNGKAGSCDARELALFGLWLFLPIGFIMATRAMVYDGWRHLFFVYPAFLIFTLHGCLGFFKVLKRLTSKWISRLLFAAAMSAVAVDLGTAVAFMIRYHPMESLYFNSIVGGIRGAKNKFDLDYWGLSYERALRHILSTDRDDIIDIYFDRCGSPSVDFLEAGLRQRVRVVDNIKQAKYFISNFKGRLEEYPSLVNEFFSVKVDGVKILAAYKLK